MRRTPVLVLPLLVLACEATPEEDPPTRDAAPWERPDVRPVLDHPLFEAHPELADLALFAERHDGPEADRPPPSARGTYAVGNGRVAALLGLADPIDTLHGLVGPTYRTRGRFFGDLALRPVVGGLEVASEVAWIGRPRGTGLVVTRRDAGALTLYTVDVAPRPAGVDPLAVPPVILRFLAVTAREDGLEVAVDLDAADVFAPDAAAGGVLATALDGGTRLGLLPFDGSWTDAGGAWRLALGTSSASTPLTAVVALATADDAAGLDALRSQLEGVDPEVWLADTLAWWTAWSATGLQLDLDSPWLLDLLDGLRVQVRLQQSAAGGVVPLSRYTGTWLRDTIGPARFFARLGLTEEVASMVDYLELCHRLRGDFGNSCSSGLVPADVPFDLDWSANTVPFTGRTAAEGPSHVPLAFRELVRWTGDWQPALDHQAYLHRAMTAQTVSPEGWQRWSGDETYRLAMEVALGYPVETAWDTKAFSSASSHLFSPAARFVAEVDERAGLAAEAAALRAQADLVDEGARAFVQPSGHFAAVMVDDPDLEPTTAPFEDSALQALWAGAYAADDPLALDALAGLRLVVDQGDGTFQSPPSEPYALGGPYAGGVCTGMLPGFVLWNLGVTGAPDHRQAFDQVLSYATPS
ncbi:MAG: hypothetical protein H6732_19190, partial [Alphaproteobacteria bacterium]|nr:hypothetical protein [Alphaproteobacteria bacterium]